MRIGSFLLCWSYGIYLVRRRPCLFGESVGEWGALLELLEGVWVWLKEGYPKHPFGKKTQQKLTLTVFPEKWSFHALGTSSDDLASLIGSACGKGLTSGIWLKDSNGLPTGGGDGFLTCGSFRSFRSFKTRLELLFPLQTGHVWPFDLHKSVSYHIIYSLVTLHDVQSVFKVF